MQKTERSTVKLLTQYFLLLCFGKGQGNLITVKLNVLVILFACTGDCPDYDYDYLRNY